MEIKHIGTYVASDPNNFGGSWRSYLHIHVSLDVWVPLEKKMKLKKRMGARFGSCSSMKDSRLHTFFYFCGYLGYSDNFYRKSYESTLSLAEYAYL